MNLRVSFPDFPRESCPQRHTISKYLHSIFTTLLWWKNSKRIYAKIATNIGLVLLSWHDTRNAIRNVRRQKLLKMFQQSLLRMIYICQGKIPIRWGNQDCWKRKGKWSYAYLHYLWAFKDSSICWAGRPLMWRFISTKFSAGCRLDLHTFTRLTCPWVGLIKRCYLCISSVNFYSVSHKRKEEKSLAFK